MTSLLAGTHPSLTAPPRAVVDNRVGYLGFAAAYVLGHGLTALTTGTDPALDLPSAVPVTALGAGLTLGTVASTVAGMRAQRGQPTGDARPAQLIGAAWLTGFAALFLLITGLVRLTGDPTLQTVLWPTGSGFVVGMIYLAEGALRRDTLHYALGTWLLLVAAAALLLPPATALAALALAGGGAYLAAFTVAQARGRSGRRTSTS